MSSGDPFDDYDPDTARAHARARARVADVGPGCLLAVVCAAGAAALGALGFDSWPARVLVAASAGAGAVALAAIARPR